MQNSKLLKFYEKPAFNLGCFVVAALTIYLYSSFIHESPQQENEKILKDTMIKCLKGDIPDKPIKDIYGKNLEYFDCKDTKRINFVIMSSGPSKRMDHTVDNIGAKCFMSTQNTLVIIIGDLENPFNAQTLTLEDLDLTHDQLKY